jgi:hypothetical protein
MRRSTFKQKKEDYDESIRNSFLPTKSPSPKAAPTSPYSTQSTSSSLSPSHASPSHSRSKSMPSQPSDQPTAESCIRPSPAIPSSPSSPSSSHLYSSRGVLVSPSHTSNVPVPYAQRLTSPSTPLLVTSTGSSTVTSTGSSTVTSTIPSTMSPLSSTRPQPLSPATGQPPPSQSPSHSLESPSGSNCGQRPLGGSSPVGVVLSTMTKSSPQSQVIPPSPPPHAPALTPRTPPSDTIASSDNCGISSTIKDRIRYFAQQIESQTPSPLSPHAVGSHASVSDSSRSSVGSVSTMSSRGKSPMVMPPWGGGKGSQMASQRQSFLRGDQSQSDSQPSHRRSKSSPAIPSFTPQISKKAASIVRLPEEVEKSGDRLYSIGQDIKKRIDKLKEDNNQRRNSQLTFKPRLNLKEGQVQGELLQRQELFEKQKNDKIEKDLKLKELAEVAGVTFKPNLAASKLTTERLLANKDKGKGEKANSDCR